MQKPELSPEELQNIARQHNVNVPISAYRVVGDRVELFLYGGAVVQHAGTNRTALEDLDTKQLKQLATQLDLPGRSKMKRPELLMALAQVDPGHLDHHIAALL